MNKKLGIYATSDQHLEEIISLCRAAKKKQVEVSLFFTHISTRLCKDPRMEELRDLAQVTLCKVGFEDNKLERSDSILDDKAFTSQSQHAEMIYDCDRYLVF